MALLVAVLGPGATAQTSLPLENLGLERGTRLGLEQSAGGVRIAHYAIRTAAFDRGTLLSRLGGLVVWVLAAPDEPDVVRFADDNGITVALRPQAGG